MQQIIPKFNPIRLLFGALLMGVLAWGCGEAEEAEPAAEEVVTPAPEPIKPIDTMKLVDDSTTTDRPINRQ